MKPRSKPTTRASESTASFETQSQVLGRAIVTKLEELDLNVPFTIEDVDALLDHLLASGGLTLSSIRSLTRQQVEKLQMDLASASVGAAIRRRSQFGKGASKWAN
jgi:hypothetical protein